MTAAPAPEPTAPEPDAPCREDRTPLQRTLRAGVWAFLLGAPLAALAGLLLGGTPGMWGALIGLAIPAAFLSVTIVVAVATARLATTTMGAVVLGSWLVKLVVFGAVVAALRDAMFYSKLAFVAAFAVGVVGYLALEALVLVRTRELYVTPSPSPRAPAVPGGGPVRNDAAP